MAYTNVWTTAAPLDTQAANQGAVDFRATKLDVMQRIASFGAGLLASRPTPETTSASADWTGVMYWATDTKQTFRWNGSSWDDISDDLPVLTSAPLIDSTTVTNTGPSSHGLHYNGNTVTYNANDLKAGDVINFVARVSVTYLGTPSTTTAELSQGFGGNTLSNIPISDVTQEYILTAQIAILTNTTARGVFICYSSSIVLGTIDITIADITTSGNTFGTGGQVLGSSGVNQNTVVFDYLSATLN